MQICQGPIVTLNDARAAHRNLDAVCACGWMTGFDPYELICAVGGDAKIRDLGPRLRCKRCRKRTMTLDYARNFLERERALHAAYERAVAVQRRERLAATVPVEIAYADFIRETRAPFSR